MKVAYTANALATLYTMSEKRRLEIMSVIERLADGKSALWFWEVV